MRLAGALFATKVATIAMVGERHAAPLLLTPISAPNSQSRSRLVAATAARVLPLLRRLRRLLMWNLRLQLLILRRQIRIFLRQRIHAPRQIRVLLLQVRQLPLQLLILLSRLRVLASCQRQSKARRQHQTRNPVFPHSFSHSLGDQLRECPYVLAPSAPGHKPYPFANSVAPSRVFLCELCALRG